MEAITNIYMFITDFFQDDANAKNNVEDMQVQMK